MEYYPAIKRNELLVHTTQMNVGIIMWSEKIKRICIVLFHLHKNSGKYKLIYSDRK